MKRKYLVNVGNKTIERQYSYIPFRYILAVLITLLEVSAIIGIVVFFCIKVPYFYVLAYLTEFFCVIKIISSNDNPEYKIPWLLFVLILPVIGFMLYFIFYSRTFKKKFVKRLEKLYTAKYPENSEENFSKLKKENLVAYNQAKLLCSLSYSNIFTNTKQTYFPLGEDMYKSMLVDLKNAHKFIYLEYFIIEEGEFWNSILEILKCHMLKS